MPIHFFLLSAILTGLLSCSGSISPQSDPRSSPTPIHEVNPLPLPHTVGVLPFDYHGHDSRWSWLRHGLPDMLITDLVSRFGMMIISRESLGEVLREQWLQHRGMSESKDAVKLGRLSGARYLLKGSIYDIQNDVMVDIHMLDVERGSVIRTSRAVGSYGDVPSLEKQLSVQIQNWFSSLNLNRSSDFKVSQELVDDEEFQEVDDSRAVLDVPVASRPRTPNPYVLGLDLQLSLERRQRMREEAWNFASDVWKSALSIELSSPEVSDVVYGSELTASEGIVKIPLTAYFHSDSLNNIHRALEVSVLETDGETFERRRLVWKGDVSTNRLFAEHFRAPRRVFVRAISESGQVIGVSSSWSWRTEKTVQVHESGGIDIAVWPESIIHGKADFAKNLLARDQDIKRFDAITVLVPDERRTISVELVESDTLGNPVSSEPNPSPIRFRQSLKNWFSEHWAPPVAEFLPLQGYLPGNKRTILLRVTGQHNTVHTARISGNGGESLLLRDIKSLLKRLVKSCLFDCRTSVHDIQYSQPFEVRVQLDLYKDLRQVGLGKTVSVGK